jgi:uncharacterized protein (DUF2252 family)
MKTYETKGRRNFGEPTGNPAHDLVRLALSLATAARGSDLPGVTVVKMMEQMIDGYEQALVPRPLSPGIPRGRLLRRS